MKFNIIKKSILAIFIAGFALNISAQDNWTVPADQKDITSPLPFSTKLKQQGKDIYNKNCKSCHGEPGKENFVALNPSPGDPAGQKFAANTDGKLFYKITKGRGEMPKFKDLLSENDRWAVISYIRSFHEGYVPASTSNNETDEEIFKGENLQIAVELNNDKREAIATITGEINGERTAANGVRVRFFVKRNFGLLPVGDIATTDAQGIAKAVFPDDLPGDSTGTYKMVVKLIDNDMYGNVEYTKDVAWGEEFVWKNPIDKRAMWGNRSHAPLWLLITYFSMLGAAFITIGWVLLQMKKLKSLGK